MQTVNDLESQLGLAQEEAATAVSKASVLEEMLISSEKDNDKLKSVTTMYESQLGIKHADSLLHSQTDSDALSKSKSHDSEFSMVCLIL